MATGEKNYDIAKETTSQEILNKLSGENGGKIMLSYGNVPSGNSTQPNSKVINGKGEVTFWRIGNDVGYLHIAVDGSEYTSSISVYSALTFTVKFNSEIKFYNERGTGYDIQYLAQYQ